MVRALGAWYEVATSKRAVYVRVHGLATMNDCLCVRDFIERMQETGHDTVVADLGDCTGMDSTFMGVLAGAALFEAGKTPRVVVLNAGDDLVKLLRSVGLTELIDVASGRFDVPDMRFVRLEERMGQADRLALVRSAHEELVRVCDKNEEIFGPLLESLEREMKKKGMT